MVSEKKITSGKKGPLFSSRSEIESIRFPVCWLQLAIQEPLFARYKFHGKHDGEGRDEIGEKI